MQILFKKDAKCNVCFSDLYLQYFDWTCQNTIIGQTKLIKKKQIFPLMRWVEDVLITHTQQSSIKFLFSQNTAGSFRFVLTWIVGLQLSSKTNVHCSIGSSGTTTSSHHNTPTCRRFWQMLRGSWGWRLHLFTLKHVAADCCIQATTLDHIFSSWTAAFQCIVMQNMLGSYDLVLTWFFSRCFL